MITKIAAIISECGVNIENLTNKSKKDYAYTLVDIKGAVGSDVVGKIQAIEGVIRVSVYR